jgi:hypothetical protein
MIASRRAAAKALRIGGVLIWLAAVIHFAAFPFLRGTVAAQLTPVQYAFIWPPFAFSFLLDGILLLPLGLGAFLAAGGALRGEGWATIVGMATALVLLALPIVLVAVMGVGYFTAPLFLVATLAIVAAGIVILVAVARLRSAAA